jgi:transcriptional regulator NrdR family protein
MPSAFLIPTFARTYPLAIFIPVCQYIDMVCIYCEGKTRITNSRPQKRLMQTWRRHQCLNCDAIFTTIETVDLTTSLTVRSGGHLEPFSRDKLFLSIHNALGHRENAVEDASAITATVITKLRTQAQNSLLEIMDIIQSAYETLNRFDKAAAVQYSAYHKLTKR